MNHPKKRLDAVAEILMGQAPPGESYNLEGDGWPLLAGPGDFKGDHPVAKKFTTEASKISMPGDIIIGVRASIGDKVIADQEYCLGRGVAALRARSEVHDRYLWHWLSSIKPSLEAKGKGATFKQVTKEDIAELEIPLPPLEEQRRIAAILDSVNQLTQLRQRSSKAIDHLKQAAFRSALINRETQSSGGATIPLGECLNFITSGGRGWSKYCADSGFRFIRSGDVQMNRVIRSNPQYVQPPDNAEAKRTRVLDGDVLLTITGSRIGRVAPASSEDSGAFISQHVAIIRVDNTKLLPSFVSFFLSMPGGGQAQIRKSQYGQTKPGLNFEQIQKFSIPRLSLDAQLEVMSRIASIDNLFDAQSRHATRIDEALASVSAFAFNANIEI